MNVNVNLRISFLNDPNNNNPEYYQIIVTGDGGLDCGATAVAAYQLTSDYTNQQANVRSIDVMGIFPQGDE